LNAKVFYLLLYTIALTNLSHSPIWMFYVSHICSSLHCTNAVLCKHVISIIMYTLPFPLWIQSDHGLICSYLISLNCFSNVLYICSCKLADTVQTSKGLIGISVHHRASFFERWKMGLSGHLAECFIGKSRIGEKQMYCLYISILVTHS